MEDLLESERAEGGETDGENLCDTSEALGGGELEVELKEEDFGEGERKHLEAGRLED